MRNVNWHSYILTIGLTVLLHYGVNIIPGYAGTIFTEDYEVANVNGLTAKGWGVFGDTVDIVSSPVHGGSKALRFTYQGIHTDDCCNSKIYRSFPAAPEIYERYYVRYAPINPSQPSGFTKITAKQHYFKNDITGLPNFVSNYFWGDPRIAMSSQTRTVTKNLYANVADIPMNNNQWYCVETHLKFNTPNQNNGLVEMWVDGVQTVKYTDNWRDSSTAAAAFTFLEIYRQGADNQYRYEDDFVLSTTRIGCSGNPAQAPAPPTQPGATAPASPTNLVVR